MPRRRPRPRQLDVRVVLDANALYTGSAHHFLREEVAELIEQHSNVPDLTVRWLVPEVVRHERQFQMLQAALQLLPAIEKLERVLGHNLNITREILETRVCEAIDRQVQKYGITVQPLSPGEIDWMRLVRDAAYRRPPFQHGEKEKGFRDSIILETFVQVVAGSPLSASTARVVLVSNDQLLRNAAQARLSSAANVHVLESVDALKGLLNTLGSTVDEQFIAAITDRAGQLFYEHKDESTLYYKASIGSVLNQTLKDAKIQLPPGANKYTIEQWTISPPSFVRKQSQRVYWSTRFQARLKAVKSSPPSEALNALYVSESGAGVPLSALSGVIPAGGSPSAPLFGTSLGASIRGVASSWQDIGTSGFLTVKSDQLVGYGTAHLDVLWSLAVATSGMLTKPKLESVSFVEIVWD